MIRRSFEDTTYPLPFVTPPAPRPSFSDRLQRSSYLFPKTVSSPRIMNNINRDYMKMNNSNSTDCSDAEAASKEAVDISSSSSSSSELRPSKKKTKTVRFNNKAILHRMDSPTASAMDTGMKQSIWYNSNDYDHFKYEAAKHAGVKIVRYNSASSQKANQGHHFVMMGDFDSQEGTELVVSTNGTANSDKAAAGKCYYNENEYKDHVNGRGEVICKRGLGYHFSRSRKKSRVVTRSAVVAWQKTLLHGYNIPSSSNSNQPTSQDDIPMARTKPNTSGDGGGDANKLDKSRVMLELVSTKCSRVARAEAKWRGSVDYRVAYPERHDDCDSSSGGDSDSKLKKSPVAPGTHLKRNSNVSSTMSKKVFGSDEQNSRSDAETKKRLCGGVVDLTGADSSHKRQKTTSRGCGANSGNELSSATIGYLSGILHTEV